MPNLLVRMCFDAAFAQKEELPTHNWQAEHANTNHTNHTNHTNIPNILTNANNK